MTIISICCLTTVTHKKYNLSAREILGNLFIIKFTADRLSNFSTSNLVPEYQNLWESLLHSYINLRAIAHRRISQRVVGFVDQLTSLSCTFDRPISALR